MKWRYGRGGGHFFLNFALSENCQEDLSSENFLPFAAVSSVTKLLGKFRARGQFSVQDLGYRPVALHVLRLFLS